MRFCGHVRGKSDTSSGSCRLLAAIVEQPFDDAGCVSNPLHPAVCDNVDAFGVSSPFTPSPATLRFELYFSERKKLLKRQKSTLP